LVNKKSEIEQDKVSAKEDEKEKSPKLDKPLLKKNMSDKKESIPRIKSKITAKLKPDSDTESSSSGSIEYLPFFYMH